MIQSDIKDKVEAAMKAFDYDAYTASDVERALSHETCSIEDFKALLSPAAAPLSGSHGKKGRGDHEKPFWEYCIYFYSLFTLPITARITVFTVVLTAIITSAERS